MASINTLNANPMNSSTARRHQNSGTFAAALRRMFGTHKKHYNTGNGSPVNFCQGFKKSDEVSARKLAAWLWQLWFMEVSGDGSFRSFMSHSEVANGNVKITFPHCHNSGEKFKTTKVLLRRPVTILRSRNGLQRELQSSLPCIKCSKEEATKLIRHRDSVGTALLEELNRAQRSINKLKAEHKSSKKKVEQLLQNLEKEKIRWKQREYQKIQAMLDYLRDKLARERRSRERMEFLNTKLVHELAEAKTNYEKEKKERKLTQEICNQLSMQIGEDKAKLEGLLSVFMKLCKEVEEERTMMKMAELWREERVQMKLADAKLVLEHKYNQVVQLIAYLQIFLRSRGAELGTNIELEETQLTRHAVESINVQRILELSFDFSKSDDIFTIYEELRKHNAGDERVINPNFLPTFTGPLSTIHIVTLDEEGLNKKSVLYQSSPYSDCDTVLEPTNSSECSEKLGVNGACNVSARPSKCRASSASKLLRSCRNVGTTSSAAKASRGTASTSPCKGCVEGSFRHSKILFGQGNSRDTMNPHITRGMRGCIEWPRGLPKANSKVIPLEERVRSQKSQLQNILKHKA